MTVVENKVLRSPRHARFHTYFRKARDDTWYRIPPVYFGIWYHVSPCASGNPVFRLCACMRVLPIDLNQCLAFYPPPPPPFPLCFSLVRYPPHHALSVPASILAIESKYFFSFFFFSN